MANRISKKDYYLSIAKSVSKRSTCLRRQYGAIIVKSGEIISTGYNGNPRGEFNCCDLGVCHRTHTPHNSGDYSDCFSVHAEQNAMLSPSRQEMIGSVMYLAGFENGKEIVAQPCPICLRMIKNSGISKVITKNDEINIDKKGKKNGSYR